MEVVILRTERRKSGTPPLLIMVSKGVSKKATERNLLKRRIRAIFEPILKNNDKKFVVIMRKGAAKRTYEELKKEINEKVINLKKDGKSI